MEAKGAYSGTDLSDIASMERACTGQGRQEARGSGQGDASSAGAGQGGSKLAGRGRKTNFAEQSNRPPQQNAVADHGGQAFTWLKVNDSRVTAACRSRARC